MSQAKMEISGQFAAASARPARRAYHAPEIVCYGSVAKLTQGNTGTAVDGGVMPTQTL